MPAGPETCHFLSQAGESSNPKHADRAGVASEALGDLVVGEIFEVSQHDDLPVIVRESFQGGGQQELLFVADQGIGGRGGIGGQEAAEAIRRLGELLVEGDFAVEVTFLSAAVASDFVREDVGEDLAQPGGEFGPGAAAELGKIACGFQQGLLDDIRGIELGLETRLELGSGQEPEPGLVMGEQPVGGEGVSTPEGGQPPGEVSEVWIGRQCALFLGKTSQFPRRLKHDSRPLCLCSSCTSW